MGAPILLLLLLGIGGFVLYRRSQRTEEIARQQNATYSPTTTSFPAASSPVRNGNAGARAGQTVVDEVRSLEDGASVMYRIPAGHYRVRVTAGKNGIKARWVGVACSSSPQEQRVYETLCDPAAEVQFVVDNPTTFGLGATEPITVSVVTK